MPKTASELNEIILSFLRVLSSKGISIDKVYLYGSQAKGTSRPDSDIDLIVVSSSFSKMPFWKRWEIVGDALAEVMEPIEALVFSQEEFDHKKEKTASFLHYIIKQPETIEILI
ncbi:MAG: nucleotidyltransferase domain-containing protein [Tepidanaerobacteraceae bacterium]|nr:nucleotidyltransferase domain-containing protein [Tepidanaerobacteraceae bacterium]